MSEATPDQACEACHKPPDLCVCKAIAPITNRIAVLILQHPQEQDRMLGTARLLQLQLRNSTLAIGLSWPSLSAALTRPADPRRWGTLYLGALPATIQPAEPPDGTRPVLSAVAPDGRLLSDQPARFAELEGLILLDGSWSQAKALWWRNPWLLKTTRLVLHPPAKSLYGALRREPRADSVSTIEAGALALAAIEDDPTLATTLLRPFALLLEKFRTETASPRTAGRRRTGPPRPWF